MWMYLLLKALFVYSQHDNATMLVYMEDLRLYISENVEKEKVYSKVSQMNTKTLTLMPDILW